MNKHYKGIATLLVIGCIYAVPAAADDDDSSSDDKACYEYEEVNVPDGDGGELYTSWFGINDSEIVVGNYCIESDCSVSTGGYVVGAAAYNRKKGTFSTFTVPGAYNWIGSVSVNSSGVMAGEALVAATSGDTVTSFVSGAGFIRNRKGTVTVPSPPISGVTFWGFADINSRGQTVGFYEDSAGRIRGFIRSKKGVYTLYDAGSTGDTYLSAINDSGNIAGDYRVGADREAFVDDGDGPEFFDAPGGTRTSATGINNSDVVVGVSAPTTGSERTGFVRDDNDFAALEFPGAYRTTMIGINNRGTVVGTYDFFSYGVIADPVKCDDDDDRSDDDDSSDD